MLMAWGPFRFTVPTYSIETIRRSQQPRAEPQPVIGRAPPIHRLGPSNPMISLASTFHPRHFNGGGLAQLSGVRQAVDALTPLQLVHINSAQMNIFGSWIATGIESEETVLDTRGIAQFVTVTLSMVQYGTSPGRGIAQLAAIGGGLGISGSFGAGGLSIGGSLSVGGLSLSGTIGF